MASNKIKVAMIGTKGIPAKWGGIEKYIEEVGKRLVQRRHEVTVFGSKWFCGNYHKSYYHGIKIRSVPSIHKQSTDALSNGFISTLYTLIEDYDIVHLHGYASYFYVPIINLLNKKTVITAHGMESGWDNPKYGSTARKIIKAAFKIGITKADIVTTVADHLCRRIMSEFGIDSTVVPSGISIESIIKPDIIKEKYKLNGNDYILFLGRIDPIKRVDWVVALSDVIDSNFRVVIAGGPQDASSAEYFELLKKKASNSRKCIFTGPVSGKEKQELLSNCRLFVTPSLNEGLPVALLEASSFERLCLASDIPAHREVIDDGLTGFLFDSKDENTLLKKTLQLLFLPENQSSNICKSAKEKVLQKFNWDVSTSLIEKTYYNLLN